MMYETSTPTSHLCYLVFLICGFQYIAMYGDIGQKSNTMFFSDKPADVNALMAQAATIFKAAPSPDQQSTDVSKTTEISAEERDSV